MADGYLESHYAEYEKRKVAWLKKKKHAPRTLPSRGEDEAL
ncbi:MAG: dehydrogenase [Paludibacteraceae bacterium]